MAGLVRSVKNLCQWDDLFMFPDSSIAQNLEPLLDMMWLCISKSFQLTAGLHIILLSMTFMAKNPFHCSRETGASLDTKACAFASLSGTCASSATHVYMLETMDYKKLNSTSTVDLLNFFRWLCLLIAEVLRSFVFHTFFRVQSIWWSGVASPSSSQPGKRQRTFLTNCIWLVLWHRYNKSQRYSIVL